MVEQGVVACLDKEKIIVSMKRRSACGSCKACGMTESGERTLEFENTVGARKGDSVEIELDDRLILKGAFIVYLLPLAGLITGIAAGALLAGRYTALPAEALSASMGVVFMAAAAMAARKYNETNKASFRPRIKTVIASEHQRAKQSRT